MSLAKVFAEINALADAGIVASYAVGGAVAAVNYLEPVSTQDVDIFVAFRAGTESHLAPLGPIYEFLVSRGAKPEGAHVVIGSWPVQILPADDPLLIEGLQHARNVDVDGVPVRILSPEHLAAIALDTGRTKDKIRLTMFLGWDGFDRTHFDDIVARHSTLLAKWAAFQRQFLDEG